jgi:hypothetical protein
MGKYLSYNLISWTDFMFELNTILATFILESDKNPFLSSVTLLDWLKLDQGVDKKHLFINI